MTLRNIDTEAEAVTSRLPVDGSVLGHLCSVKWLRLPARNVRWRLNLVVANVQITGLRTAARQKIDPRGRASGAGAAQEEEEERTHNKEEEEEVTRD